MSFKKKHFQIRKHSGQIFINLLLTFCILFFDRIKIIQIFIWFYFQKSHWSWRSMIKHFVPTGLPTLLVIGRGGFIRGERSIKPFRSDGAYSRGTYYSTATSPQTSMDRIMYLFEFFYIFCALKRTNWSDHTRRMQSGVSGRWDRILCI